jgi:hypothetical protein
MVEMEKDDTGAMYVCMDFGVQRLLQRIPRYVLYSVTVKYIPR